MTYCSGKPQSTNVVTLRNPAEQIIWGFRKDGNTLIAIHVDGDQFAWVNVEAISKGGFRLWRLLVDKNKRSLNEEIEFRIPVGGLTRRGKVKYNAQEMVPVYRGPTGDSRKIQYFLRLGSSYFAHAGFTPRK